MAESFFDVSWLNNITQNAGQWFGEYGVWLLIFFLFTIAFLVLLGGVIGWVK